MKLAEKENKMVSSFAMDLFKDPFFIGFNRELDRLNYIHKEATSQSFPPYNITKLDEDSYRVSLAVAGFDRKDIEVSVDNGTLIIKGEIKSDAQTGEVLHKGIATRKFTRTFALGEYMEVIGAEMLNGMLHIDVDRLIPEEKKPRTIKVK